MPGNRVVIFGALVAGAILASLLMSSGDVSSTAATPKRCVSERTSSSCDPSQSAMIDCKTGRDREFYVQDCDRSFTVAQLLPDFMAHQVEWSIMGRNSAFWSVLTGMSKNDDEIQANSDAVADFFESGKDTIREALRNTAGNISGWKLRGDVLDFGCGLGRLGLALAQQPGVRSVTCVEQSVFHVEKAERFTRDRPRVGAFRPIVSGPDMLMALRQSPEVPKCYDFVNSIIVLQHIMTPLQTVYLEQLCDVLRPGGVMHIQIPHRSPSANPKGCTLDERHALRVQGGMQMHSTSPAAISALLKRRGCEPQLHDIGWKYVAAEGDKHHASTVVIARKRSGGGVPIECDV